MAVYYARPTWKYPKWAALRAATYTRDGYTCQHCGWAPSEIPSDYDGRTNIMGWTRGVLHQLEVDHIVPISRGGINTLDNFQTLCSDCNTRKGTRMPAETVSE